MWTISGVRQLGLEVAVTWLGPDQLGSAGTSGSGQEAVKCLQWSGEIWRGSCVIWKEVVELEERSALG